MNTTDGISSLVSRINSTRPINFSHASSLLTCLIADAYNSKWAQAEEGKPQIIFDKEACCKPPTNFAHNLWWVYVQPQDHPCVAGYGKTLVEALQSLLDQLRLSPQEWTARRDAEHDMRLSADLNGITTAMQFDKLNTKTTAQPKLNVTPRSQDVPSASMPAPSMPNSGPGSQPPLSKKAKKAAKWAEALLATKTSHNVVDATVNVLNTPRSGDDGKARPQTQTTTVAELWKNFVVQRGSQNMPGTASSSLQSPQSNLHAWSTAATTRLELQEGREKQQHKETDVGSGQDEQEGKRKDAEKQAHKRAEVSAAQQVSKFEPDGSKTFEPTPPIFSFKKTLSSNMDRGVSPNRFVQTTRPAFDSNSFHFGTSSTASSFHFGSDIVSRHVTAHSGHFAKPANTPFQTTSTIQDTSLSRNVTMSTNSSQDRLQLGNNFSSRPDSSVIDEHVREDLLKRYILEPVDMQQASKKIKLEDTAQDPGSPANESTTAVPSLRRSPSLSEWQPLGFQKVEKKTQLPACGKQHFQRLCGTTLANEAMIMEWLD